jgi:hypothetical protein
MTRSDDEPSTGWAFLGTAAASFATGPTLMLTYGIHAMLTDPTATDMDAQELGALGTILVYSSFMCLIGSIPAATVNAIALSRLAHSERDAVWWAIASGGIIGLLVAFIINGSVGEPNLRFAPWFAATGGLMGLLHWLIAIRPRRRWRLRLLLNQVAIRAME